MNGIALAMSGARAPTRAKNSASPEEKTVRSTAANGSSSHDQVGTTAPMPGSSPVTIVTTIIATRIGANMTVSVITVDSGTTARGNLWDRISCRLAGIEFSLDMTEVWNSEYVNVPMTMNAARVSMPGARERKRARKMPACKGASSGVDAGRAGVEEEAEDDHVLAGIEDRSQHRPGLAQVRALVARIGAGGGEVPDEGAPLPHLRRVAAQRGPDPHLDQSGARCELLGLRGGEARSEGYLRLVVSQVRSPQAGRAPRAAHPSASV